MSYDINSQQVDIENLFKQNVNDLASIKELYRKLKDLEEKISQNKYIDSKLTDKLKKDYEKLKRIILDENIQIELKDKIDKNKTELDEINTQLDTKANLNSVFSMANMGQDVKEAMTGGSVAVVGAEMINYINMNESSVKLDTLNEEVFNDKTIKTYNATYTSPLADDNKKYFPSTVLVTLNSSKLIENITVKAKVRNIENSIKVQVRVECVGSVIQGSEISFTNACEIYETINVNKTSDRVRVYFFVQGSVDVAKYQIIDIDISVNGGKADINTIGDLAVSFGTGTISNYIKKYKAVASREYVNSVVNSVNWTNQKLIVYGDSISDDDFFDTKTHYYDFISKKTGIKSESYAVGGSGYAYNSTVTQSIQKWGATNNMLHQIDNYGNGSPKFVIVECGTNDWGFTTCDLGNMGDILDDNSTTFYGNIGKACRKLKTKFPYSKILFCTLLPRYDVTNYMYGKVNAKGNTMKEYSQAIKDVCEAYSINVLDMYAKSQLFNPDVQPEWWHDRLHPSKKYHEDIFCDLVLNELKSM